MVLLWLVPHTRKLRPRRIHYLPRITGCRHEGARIRDQGCAIPHLNFPPHILAPGWSGSQIWIKTFWVLWSLSVFQTGCCSRPPASCSRKGSPFCWGATAGETTLWIRSRSTRMGNPRHFPISVPTSLSHVPTSVTVASTTAQRLSGRRHTRHSQWTSLSKMGMKVVQGDVHLGKMGSEGITNLFWTPECLFSWERLFDINRNPESPSLTWWLCECEALFQVISQGL